MDYALKIDEKRQKIVNTLIEFIETNPTEWNAGWWSVSQAPFNGKTQKKYKGVNAFYLMVLASMSGYKDPRWFTFNQVKELGANVRAGEKSSEVFYWSYFDKNTKKPFEDKTVENMTDEERRQYIKDNVRPIIKFYQVFNAEQCDNMPEYKHDIHEMDAAERQNQNAMIEQIIANSEAPINFDGGNSAYYSPLDDNIHLPEISAFKSMQDYYATTLHEIAHSTGHESRLNRNIKNFFGTPEYAKEELRAELASIFMQLEYGISIEGKHFENHGAYLASWLKAVKNNQKEFFAAANDAEKITSYIGERYLQEHKEKEVVPIFEANTSFAKQVDAVLAGQDTTSTHLKVMGTPFILRQLGAKNLPVLMTAKHLKSIISDRGNDTSVNYHGLDVDIVKRLPELIADPVMVMDSITRDDSVVVLMSTMDSESRPVIAAIKFDGHGNLNDIEIEANILTSTYGKDKFKDFLQRNIDANTILYWDKEKSQELIKTPGVQFPDNLNLLDSNTIIRKAKAFVNSLENEKENKQAEQSQQYKQYEQVEQSNKAEQYGQAEQVQRQNKKPIVVNFYAGPGAGKTTAALELTAELKKIGVNVEYVSEYAKDLVLEGKVELLSNQQHVTDEQYHRIDRLCNAVDVIVTDSPVLLGIVYGADRIDENYRKQIRDYYDSFNNINLYVERKVAYQNEGRVETEQQARTLDTLITKMLSIQKITCQNYNESNLKEIAQYIKQKKDEELEIAKKESKVINSGEYYEKVQELETNLFYGAITQEEYDHSKQVLDLSSNVVQDEQYEQDKQYGQAEQVKQSTTKWKKIKLNPELVGEERGKSTQLKMPDGEYSSFVFFTPTQFIQRDEKSGEVQLSVNDTFKYKLMKGNQRVELTGAELRQAMAGQEIGVKAQRILSEANAQTLSDIYRNVPEEMRQYQNWCVYKTRWNNEKGKKDKQIYSPTLGLNADNKMQWASIGNPETWATFDKAMEFAKENDCEGLVFALDGRGITCIDLDKSIVKDGKLNDIATDKPDGELSVVAARLCDEMQDTYIETSASGNGIHIFIKDNLLSKGKYKNRVETPDGEIEVYDDKRFISMTGKLRSKTIGLGKSPVVTAQWLQKKLGEKISENTITIPVRKSSQVDNSDSAVMERIERSKKGSLFRQLFNGADVTGDNSRNDFMLLNMLAFFTDCDAGQMERIFKSSSLYRPEKGEQYVQRSVGKACTTLQTRMSNRAIYGAKGKNVSKGRVK